MNQETPKAAPKRTVPEGMAECFVAVPDTVHGESGRCKPGEKVLVSKKNADALELRGLAFRAADEAKAAFTTWKRKRQKALEEKAEAMRKAEERRQAWKKQLDDTEEMEWLG